MDLDLTKRQQEIFDFIKRHSAKYGYPPTVRDIGKAVGLLMAFHKISDTEAFDLLRKASQDMNIKLAEVAREVVAHHNSGHPAPRIG